MVLVWIEKDLFKLWAPYLEKYEEMLDQNTQLSMDFRNNKLFIIPKEHNVMETKNA